jgi:hypothetical protein
MTTWGMRIACCIPKATNTHLPYYLSRVDHVRKITDRKQGTDIEKYSFVNRNIKTWNQLPAEASGAFPCIPKIFRKSVRKSNYNGVK